MTQLNLGKQDVVLLKNLILKEIEVSKSQEIKDRLLLIKAYIDNKL